MGEMVDRVAEILMRCCPTEHEHSYQVAGMVIDGLGLKMEVRESPDGDHGCGAHRQIRYVTDWLEQ